MWKLQRNNKKVNIDTYVQHVAHSTRPGSKVNPTIRPTERRTDGTAKRNFKSTPGPQQQQQQTPDTTNKRRNYAKAQAQHVVAIAPARAFKSKLLPLLLLFMLLHLLV